MVRYDLTTSKPLQGVTLTSPTGEYEEVYEPITDPLISRFLSIREASGHTAPALSLHPVLRRVQNSLPFAANLSKSEFVPTRLLSLLEILRDKFPRHRLLLTDFSSLPDTVEDAYKSTAPVVQTRYRGTMVPCSTYMVQPGYFDIFFPTDFEALRDMYDVVMSNRSSSSSSAPHPSSSSTLRSLESNFFFSSGGARRSEFDLGSGGFLHDRPRIYTHKDFLLKYGEPDKTRLRSGENPMLDYFENVRFLF